jgi:hypothetical protein
MVGHTRPHLMGKFGGRTFEVRMAPFPAFPRSSAAELMVVHVQGMLQMLAFLGCSVVRAGSASASNMQQVDASDPVTAAAK